MKNLLLLLALFAALSANAQRQVYELWFSAGQIQHHGLLCNEPSTNDWLLRIKYRDPSNGAERLVEQRMTAETTRLGLCLRGGQVWDVGRQRPARDYAPDNFYLMYGADRRLYPQNRDAQGATSAMTMVLLTDMKMCNARLEEFGCRTLKPAEMVAR